MNTTAQAWLNLQCEIVPGACRGVVLTGGTGEEALEPAAYWPGDGTDVPDGLLAAARQAAASRSGVVCTECVDEDHSIIASPLGTQGAGLGAAAIEVSDSEQARHQAILQLLQWGGSWLELLRRTQAEAPSQDRLATILELLAESLEHEEFQAAATTAVTELAGRAGCERVSLGLLRGKHVVVYAMSHSAKIDARSNLVRDIGAAMDEAIDQDATLTFPPLPDAPPLVAFAQEALAEQASGSAVCSTPLFSGDRAIGALTLERDSERGFDRPLVDVCETLGSLLGPLLELKHDRGRWIGFKVWDSLHGFTRRLLGPGHFGLKLNALAATALVGFLSLAVGDFRITAPARLEGSIKHVVAAPLDGYVASASFRAGDTVAAGDVLATLDDTDLTLERVRLLGQQEQLRKEHRAALSGHDRSSAALVRARMKQTRAQIELLDEQLARTRLTAPFSGVVVSGDLSQALGSPVEQGQVLFEVALLDSYRVVLDVDERDIGEAAAGQSGQLALTGLPDGSIPLSLVRLLPVSTAEGGRNFFQVEATLGRSAATLRPGMEGVAKIDVEPRKLVWIWSHNLVNWLRLSVWTWIS